MSDKIVEEGKKLAKLRGQKEKLEAQLKVVQEQITNLQVAVIPQLMEDAEVDKITLKGIGTMFVQQKMYVGLLSDDRPTAYKWLRENGHGELIKDWVFPQTLTAFAKEQIEGGKPLPDFFKATFQPTATIRRSK